MIISKFGTVGDGLTNDSVAIQKAIDSGCGKIIFPPGRYLTGTLKLCDNLTIELMNGATIIASPDINDYNEDRSVNLASGLRHYLFEGRNIKNFTLQGNGEIQGNGHAYWEKHPLPEVKMMKAKPHRPALIHLIDCENVTIKDISIYEAPAYTIWLLGCRDVKIDGILVRNPRYGPNTDILDIDCCRNVMISNCNLEAGDDCIALKSDAARLGRKAPCENITVNNCILSSTTTAVRIGYEADEPIRNCVFSNLVIHNTRTGLDVLSLLPECAFTRIEKGTPIENIVFSNIVMQDVRRAIHVWAGGNETEQPYDAYVRGLSFCNIRATTRGTSFIGSVGATTCVSEILLRDIYIEQVAHEYDGSDDVVDYPANCWGVGNLPWSITLRKIDNIKLENVNIKRTGNLSKEYGLFKWSDIQNGTLNGTSLNKSGDKK
jgi:polygalacturonase